MLLLLPFVDIVAIYGLTAFVIYTWATAPPSFDFIAAEDSYLAKGGKQKLGDEHWGILRQAQTQTGVKWAGKNMLDNDPDGHEKLCRALSCMMQAARESNNSHSFSATKFVWKFIACDKRRY
jgi:hypothetical protein